MSQRTIHDLHLQMVGCGNMGSALLERWVSAGLQPEHCFITVASGETAQKLEAQFAHLHVHVGEILETDAPLILLAVKPQQMDKILPQINEIATGEPLILTLAAGLPLAYYEEALGSGTRVVRAMPNTPVRIGQGVTSLMAGKHVTKADRDLVETLFAPTGKTFWMEDEKQFDAAMAIAGSGPAYVFYLQEILAELAEEMGVPEDAALPLAQQTLLGADLLAANQSRPPAALRTEVTSPGGVTAAALEVLMDTKQGLKPLFKKALEANIARNQKLSSPKK